MVSSKSKNYDDLIFTENDTESDFADYTVSCICFTCFDIIIIISIVTGPS